MRYAPEGGARIPTRDEPERGVVLAYVRHLRLQPGAGDAPGRALDACQGQPFSFFQIDPPRSKPSIEPVSRLILGLTKTPARQMDAGVVRVQCQAAAQPGGCPGPPAPPG